MNAPAPEVITLGCRLNIAESETIATLVAGRDTVVVNSCAVTGAAAIWLVIGRVLAGNA